MADEDIPTDNIPVGNSVASIPNPTPETTENDTYTCQVVIESSDSHLRHPCYEVLKGGRRGQMKNMHFRIELVTDILNSLPSSYLPPNFSESACVKHWYKKYTPYLKHRNKWNRIVMAEAICQFDLLMEQSCKMDDTQEKDCKLPAAIDNFYQYMLEVREIATIAENEPLPNKKAGSVLNHPVEGFKIPLT